MYQSVGDTPRGYLPLTICACMSLCASGRNPYIIGAHGVPPTSSISWLWQVRNYAKLTSNYNQLDQFQLSQRQFCMHAERVAPFSLLPHQLTDCRLIQTSRVRLVSSNNDLDTPSYLFRQLELVDSNPAHGIRILFIL